MVEGAVLSIRARILPVCSIILLSDRNINTSDRFHRTFWPVRRSTCDWCRRWWRELCCQSGPAYCQFVRLSCCQIGILTRPIGSIEPSGPFGVQPVTGVADGGGSCAVNQGPHTASLFDYPVVRSEY